MIEDRWVYAAMRLTIVPGAYPGENKMWLKNAHSLTSTVENPSLATDIYRYSLYLRND